MGFGKIPRQSQRRRGHQATGLLNAVEDHRLTFTATMVHRILSLLNPTKTHFSRQKATDLYTGVKLVRSALEYVEKLRCDSEFEATDAPPAPSKQKTLCKYKFPSKCGGQYSMSARQRSSD